MEFSQEKSILKSLNIPVGCSEPPNFLLVTLMLGVNFIEFNWPFKFNIYKLFGAYSEKVMIKTPILG